MVAKGWNLVGDLSVEDEVAITRWVAARTKPALIYEGIVFVDRAMSRRGNRPSVEVILTLAGFLVTRQHEGEPFLERRWSALAEVADSRAEAMAAALQDTMGQAERSLRRESKI
jgi:hypothetical protein